MSVSASRTMHPSEMKPEPAAAPPPEDDAANENDDAQALARALRKSLQRLRAVA